VVMVSALSHLTPVVVAASQCSTAEFALFSRRGQAFVADLTMT
jgi:hypothetical protein